MDAEMQVALGLLLGLSVLCLVLRLIRLRLRRAYAKRLEGITLRPFHVAMLAGQGCQCRVLVQDEERGSGLICPVCRKRWRWDSASYKPVVEELE